MSWCLDLDGHAVEVLGVDDAPTRWALGDITRSALGAAREQWTVPEGAVAGLWLTQRINRAVLDAHPDRLHLHAGAVTIDGRGLVIAAPSGTGKSTLVAELVKRGAHYATDEAVGLALDGSGPRTVAKPLCLDEHSVSLLGLGVDQWVAAGPERLVPGSALGAVIEPTGMEVLVCFERRPGPAQLVPLHPIETTFRLLCDALDVHRAGPAGVDTLIGHLAGASCWWLAAESLEAAADAVAEAVAQRVTQRRTALLPSRHPGPDDTSLVMVGEQGLLHDRRVERIALLDATGVDRWRELVDSPGTDDSFRNELVERGLWPA